MTTSNDNKIRLLLEQLCRYKATRIRPDDNLNKSVYRLLGSLAAAIIGLAEFVGAFYNLTIEGPPEISLVTAALGTIFLFYACDHLSRAWASEIASRNAATIYAISIFAALNGDEHVLTELSEKGFFNELTPNAFTPQSIQRFKKKFAIEHDRLHDTMVSYLNFMIAVSQKSDLDKPFNDLLSIYFQVHNSNFETLLREQWEKIADLDTKRLFEATLAKKTGKSLTENSVPSLTTLVIPSAIQFLIENNLTPDDFRQDYSRHQAIIDAGLTQNVFDIARHCC